MKLSIFIFASFLSINIWAQNETRSLFFNINVNELTSVSQAVLDSLLKIENITDIKLVGYSDTTGKESINLRLSEARVNSIKNLIISKGLNVSESSFLGEKYPPNSKNIGNYPYWRRVDFSFSKNKEKEIFESIAEENIEPITYEEDKFNINDIEKGKLEAIPLQLEFVNLTAEFMPYSTPELEKLFGFMKKNQKVKAFIRGHVCCNSGEMAISLSKERAKAVYDYLVSNGISTKRISFEGFGNTIPLVWPELNEEDEQRNRRVDVIFSIE